MMLNESHFDILEVFRVGVQLRYQVHIRYSVGVLALERSSGRFGDRMVSYG
jgi:hypothetical protein